MVGYHNRAPAPALGRAGGPVAGAQDIEVIMADKSQGGKRETRKPKKAVVSKAPNSAKK